ncbi:sarcosine oxidase subunit gamma family protein [Granulosicoccaceae sp. 1_MG-2023]|nr:sarcosine oxidase subunit gamma family protein [Granulosicoccaceae sp. 1_MG-2023]
MTYQASDFPGRSPVYRRWQDQPATPVGDTLAPLVTGGAGGAQCRLRDLSALPRGGLRGADTQALLQEAGYALPAQPNQLVQSGATLIARLSQTEHWVLDTDPAAPSDLPAVQAGRRVYTLPCQDSHAWLVLSGPARAEVMAKVCGVDMRPAAFAPGALAQTSVALVSAIVLHHQLEGEDVFSLLCDSAYADYLWGALLDAMAEFDDAAIGSGAPPDASA